MKKINVFLILMILAISGIGIVSGVTVNGSLGDSNITSINDDVGGGGGIVSNIMRIGFHDAQFSEGIQTIIAQHIQGDQYVLTTDTGAPSGAQTIVTIQNSTYADVGSGQLSYQILYDNSGNQVAGYIGLTINPGLDTSALGPGDHILFLNYTRSDLYNVTMVASGTGIQYAPRQGGVYFLVDNDHLDFHSDVVQHIVAQYNVNNYAVTTMAIYSFEKPSGLGIEGYVFKHAEGESTIYPSRVFIYPATGQTPISNELTVTNEYFYLNTNAQQIRVAILTSQGRWLNSSVLFAAAATPIPTLTPDINNPIPDGMERSEFQCVDSKTSGHVSDCDISIHDETADTWSNITDRFDGTWFIDTLPDAILSGYGSADGYASTSRLHVIASGTVMYELIMQPSNTPAAPSGKINLYIIVSDDSTGAGINGAMVTAEMFMDSTVGTSTNAAGSAQLTVKNNTAYYVTAEKVGYGSVTISGTTSDYGPDTRRIILQKTVVTNAATSTPVQGEATARPTVDTRTNAEKDESMMNLIRDNAESIIQIALLMTIIYLVGGAGKK